MAEKNVVRQSAVELDFLVKDIEALLQAETALDTVGKNAESSSEKVDALGTALGDAAETARNETSDSLHETSEKAEEAGESFLEMAAKSEMLSKISDACMEIVDAIGECISSAASFETSLAKLETIADTSSTPMDTLSEEILNLSNDTGIAAESLTESTYQAISASVDTASAVDFVTQANELAVGGFTSAETAVDVLSTAINAYGLEVDQAGQLSDYLITTQNLGKTSVDQLAQSVGKVIPLASAYNVEMDNLSSAYAILTANGIATAEATTYMKGMLNELADSGSDVAGVLQDETGMTFSELSASGKSLGEVLAIIGSSVDNDATAFSNLWSSQEAGIGALSLLNAGTEKYASVLDAMQNSTGAASEAYETMADTAEKAQQRLTTSAENLKIAVGNGLLDTFSGLNTVLADGLNWLTEFAQEHETLVSSLAIAVGAVAAVTVGVMGLSVAVTSLTAAATALNISTGGLLAAAGVVAGVIATVGIGIAAARGGIEEYDGTLQECASEIENTEAALKQLEQAGQGNSKAADDLRKKLEKLNAQYEKGGGHLADLAQQSENAAEEIQSLASELDDAYKALDDTQSNGYQAAAMLEHLSSKAEKSNTDLELMQQYADYLNDTFNCDIVVTASGDVDGFDMSNIINEINTQIAENKKTEAMEWITNPEIQDNYLAQYQAVLETEQELETLNEAFSRYDEMKLANDAEGMAQWEKIMSIRFKDVGYGYTNLAVYAGQLEETLNEGKNALDESTNSIEEHAEAAGMDAATTKELLDGWAEASDAADEYADTTETLITRSKQAADGAEKATGVMEQYTDSLLELAQAYDDTYESAYASITGQFGLFDEAKIEADTYAEATIEAYQKSQQSQLDYWEHYQSNIAELQKLSASDLGVTQEQLDLFISNLQSFDDTTIAFQDNILEAVEAGNTDVLTQAIETTSELNDAQNETTQMVTDWKIDLDGAMQDIIEQMEEGVEDLDLSGAAAISADNTMSAYISAISAAKETAVSETQSLVDSVQAVLDGAGLSYSVNVDTGSATAETPAYATGTTNASDVFIAGEQGAELIVGMGGSTVFPASETEKIINAVSDYADLDFSGGYTPESTVESSYSSRTITYAPVFQLTLNGDTSSSNQKRVKRWVQQAIDDTFASVLRTNPSVYEI